jgi:hypothetical protein
LTEINIRIRRRSKHFPRIHQRRSRVRLHVHGSLRFGCVGGLGFRFRFRFGSLQRPPQVDLQIHQEPLKAIFRWWRSFLLLLRLLLLALLSITEVNFYCVCRG